MFKMIHIAKKAMRIIFGDLEDLELVLISSPGSSGARVSIFRHPRTDTLYAVKCAINSRISIMDELVKREILVPYFQRHLPKVYACQIIDGYEVMICECGGLDTLHNLIQKSDDHKRALVIWTHVIGTLVNNWHVSKHDFNEKLCPRFFPTRLQRIHHGLKSHAVSGINLWEYWESPVIVNDKEYSSIASSIQTISQVGKPSFGVVCHGDPQPSNIVVGKGDFWYAVDWEWAGAHQDWRMLLSHLHGWWSTRCLDLLQEPEVKIENNRIIINYDAVVPSHLHPFQKLAKGAAINVSNGPVSSIDHLDINRFLAALYLGEIRFLGIWGRLKFAPVMLAQGVVTASRLGDEESNFMFTT